jgi:hypothetical protein
MSRRCPGRTLLPCPGDGVRSIILLAVLIAFALRVAGHLIVVLAAPAWLPAESEWRSGVVPYSLLLAAQLAILAVLVLVVRDVGRGAGRFSAPPPAFAVPLLVLSGVYFAVMVIRYPISRLLRPEWGWLGQTIPIALHLALAAGLYVFSCPAACRGGRQSGATPDGGSWYSPRQERVRDDYGRRRS